ncbi:MAG: hypothetical protein K2W82_11725 [Candidatus Obscuribacterales bacterium]|nr:hypothetical protein [Candidatus Obscuribacterales bacterium]
MNELNQEIQTLISRRIAEGFFSDEEIAEEALESLQEDFQLDGMEYQVEKTLKKLIEAQNLEQRTWNYDTDCDKLDNAFSELDSLGIIARQNFSCCQNCGHAEIWDEIESARNEQDVTGYLFYHMEDTERACGKGVLYLAYGAIEDGDPAALTVAWQIVEALRQSGLNVEWDGNLEKRIKVYDLVWQKRRLRSLVY